MILEKLQEAFLKYLTDVPGDGNRMFVKCGLLENVIISLEDDGSLDEVPGYTNQEFYKWLQQNNHTVKDSFEIMIA